MPLPQGEGRDLRVSSDVCEKLNLILYFAANYVHALSHPVQLKAPKSSRVPAASGELAVLYEPSPLLQLLERTFQKTGF